MASSAEWSIGYARQAQADFDSFETLQEVAVPACHRLLFLQMACEKLVKAHLAATGAEPRQLQSSHAYVRRTLPVVLRQEAVFLGYRPRHARETLARAKQFAEEVEFLAPANRRGGQRPDNCEYPWEDERGSLRVPLDWSFAAADLAGRRSGRAILKLLRSSIRRLLDEQP